MLLLSNNYDLPLGRNLFFILSALILLLHSCSNEPRELLEINELIHKKPVTSSQMMQKIDPGKYKLESEQAYYGYLLYKCAEASSTTVNKDSLIQQSITYYKTKYNKHIVAECCYYFGHQLIRKQEFAGAANQLLLAENYLTPSKDNMLIAKINLDLSAIAAIQGETSSAESKALKAMQLLSGSNNTFYKSLAEIYLSKSYRIKNRLKEALAINKSLLKRNTNEELTGLILYENGLCYYQQNQLDSAQYYLQKSLIYPYKGTNYANRCTSYADLLFDRKQYDSAFHYAKLSTKYRSSYYNLRDAYRIMTNYMYITNDIQSMGRYMTMYQNYNDSVRLIENQDKVTTLEKLYIESKENSSSHKQLIIGILIFLMAGLGAIYTIITLQKKNMQNKNKLLDYKQELNKKNQLVVRNFKNKIEETRQLQSTDRKKANAQERIKLDKELIVTSLNIDKPEVFTIEMNAAFNNIVDTLRNEYEGITWKEIVWCCMHLLNIPNTERLHALETTTAGMYKMKQRLALKLNLNSAREVDKFLRKFE